MFEKALPVLCLLAMLAGGARLQAQFPEAQITNGKITAKLYLPDLNRGYYRGTRFDWSGQISSLRTKNHEYFGQWFPRYDPQLHDSIMGPVEEFLYNDAALGYGEDSTGNTFVRIGVGVLRRPAGETKFDRFKTYEIVDPGKWSVHPGRDRIRFVHELNGPSSPAGNYAYLYTKTIVLKRGSPVMLIEHTLKNTGTKPIVTSQYDHNFFVMDAKPTGPASSVKFPFELVPVHAFEGGLAETRGREIVYLKEVGPEQSVFGEYKGFGNHVSDYSIRLENRAAGAGVHITGSRPITRLIYWSIRTTFCPEAYVDLSIPPGHEAKWTYRYEFYDLPPLTK
jgi:hypothetical protein